MSERVAIVGDSELALACARFFRKHGFDIALAIGSPARWARFPAEVAGAVHAVAWRDVQPERIVELDCPVLFASSDLQLHASASRALRDAGLPVARLVRHTDLFSPEMEALLDAMCFGGAWTPGVLLRSLLSGYPRSGQDPVWFLARLLTDRIRADTDPSRRTVAVYYFTPGYRRNLGSSALYERLRERGHNIVHLFGVLCGDEFERRTPAYYAGHGLMAYLDILDAVILPALTGGLPKRAVKVLFPHDIYDSPAARRRAPDAAVPSPQQAGSQEALIDDIDYALCPSPTVMPRKRPYTRPARKATYHVPAGYPKLDGNLIELAKEARTVDSLVYAPTLVDDVFGEYGSLCDHGVEIVRLLLQSFPNHRTIFRPHPHSVGSDAVRSVLRQFTGHERFMFDSDANNYIASYGRSAVMITDLSGTAFTYAFTTLRPVVFFSPKEGSVKTAFEDARYFDHRARIGRVVTALEQLPPAVSDCLSRSAAMESEIRAFRDASVFNIGRAEDYIVETFHHVLNGTAPPEWTCGIAPLVAGGLAVRAELLQVLGAHAGFNLLRYGRRYYALAQDEGEFDLVRADNGDYRRCFAGDSLEEIRAAVDLVGGECAVPCGDYRGFDLIGTGSTYYALARSEGPFDILLARRGEYTHCHAGESIEVLKKRIDEEFRRLSVPTLRGEYCRFNVVECNGRLYALAQEEGAFDVEKADRGEYMRCITGKSMDDVKRQIEQLISNVPTTARLVEEGYRGFNVIEFRGTYYALAQDEGAFDPTKAERKEYRRCCAAASPEEAKRIVDSLPWEAPKAGS